MGTAQPCVRRVQLYRHAPDWHLRLELPHRQRHVERRLLSAAKGPRLLREGLRRALLLRGALRYRGSEFQLLRGAASGGEPGLGPADAVELRVLPEAAPAVHAPEDVSEGRARRPARRVARGAG